MARSSVRPAAGGSRHGAGAEGSPPNVCLLSNGRYTVMLTEAGSGYSTCDGIDVTRWREDATSDCWGQFFYIRDLDGGGAWSAGRQPLAGDADDYETILGSDRAVFQRRDGDIETRSEIAVAADADAEVRRITLTNHGVLPRMLDVASYAEVSLNSRRADQAHPAFAKLFLETEYLPAPPTLLCRRRPRARDQKPIWGLHFLAGPERADTAVGVVEYETDRARFLGRGRSAASPACSGFRSGPVGNRRVRPRPCFQPAPSGPAGSEHIRGPCVRNRTSRRPQRGGGAGPQVQRSGRSRAHVPTVENAQSGDSGRARHLTRRRRFVPPAGRSCSLHRASPPLARVRDR